MNIPKLLAILAIAVVSVTARSIAGEIDPTQEKSVRQFVAKLDTVFKNGRSEALLPLIHARNRKGWNAEFVRIMFLDRWGHGVPAGELSIEPYKEIPRPKQLQVGEFPEEPTFSISFNRQNGDRAESNMMFLRSSDDGLFLAFPVERSQDSDAGQKIEAQQGGTVQPATRSQSKSKGSDKPQPESEGRPR